jgi:hypothetical protein
LRNVDQDLDQIIQHFASRNVEIINILRRKGEIDRERERERVCVRKRNKEKLREYVFMCVCVCVIEVV